MTAALTLLAPHGFTTVASAHTSPASPTHYQAHNVVHANFVGSCRIDIMHGNYFVAYAKVRRRTSDCGTTGTRVTGWNGSNFNNWVNFGPSPDPINQWRQAQSTAGYSVFSSYGATWFGDSLFYFDHFAV